jgi:hypothetical protein
MERVAREDHTPDKCLAVGRTRPDAPEGIDLHATGPSCRYPVDQFAIEAKNG